MKKWLALAIVTTAVHIFVARSEAIVHAQDEIISTSCSISQDCGWYRNPVSCSCSGEYCECGHWGGSSPGVSCSCATGCAEGQDCQGYYAGGDCEDWWGCDWR